LKTLEAVSSLIVWNFEKFMRLLRGFWLVLCLCLCGSWLDALAQTQATVRLDAIDTHTHRYSPSLSVAVGVDATLSVQDIAALPSERFQPFDIAATHSISANKPLWLRLQIGPTQTGAMPLHLEFATVVVDRYEVYQKDASGAWQMTVAGDHVPHTQWPVNSLQPRFPLQISSQSALEAYIRVVHLMPSQILPELIPADKAAQRDMQHILLTGIVVGLFTVLTLVCLQMTFSYRDWTYLWYAGYLLFTMLTAIAYSGLGQYLLWPRASKFASDILVFMQLSAFAFNMQFVHAMFGQRIGRYHAWLTRLLIATCLAYITYLALGAEYANTVLLFMAIVMTCCVFVVGTAVLAWRKKIPYSGYWLFIYAPYLFSIALTSLQNAGQINLPWVPLSLPLITIMIEALAMMFCLNAFSRENHAQAVREQTIAQRDPLTGFLNESNFMKWASAAWLKAARTGGDISVAYVRVEPKERALDTVQAEALMLRSVRMVRTAVRENAGVGRIGRNTLGIAMPDVKPGDELNACLSRLVALGLMVNPYDSAAQALKFTLAVSSWRLTPEDFNLIDKHLRALLAKDTQERPRTIRFLEMTEG
jgi:two-component system, sensor histidine kinase LadS